MLLNDGQLRVGEVLSHISDNTGNDGSGDAEPFLTAAAPRPVLDAFEERGLGDVIENEGHYSNDTCVGLGLRCWC